MESLPPSRRRYGEKEIGKILRRASELQRATPARPDPAGLTLAELEEIALEAGIDVENLRRAATELDVGEGEGWGERYLGGPYALRLERVVPGELDVDDLGTLVPLIQAAAGVPGQASVVGRTLTWHSVTSAQGGHALQMLIMSKNGETMLRLEERYTQLAVGLHVGIPSGGVGIGLPAALAAGAAGGVALGLGVGIAVVGGTYWLAREIYRRVGKGRRRKMTALFERIIEQVEEAARPPSLGGADAAALPRPE